jgi:hypothetical protein
MDFYLRSDAWLFGGVFEVIERNADNYKLAPVATFEKYVGQLIAKFHRYQGIRVRAYYLEGYLDQFEVDQILSLPYAGESFPGFDNIDHDFSTLEAVFRNERAEWKAPLSSVKGAI